MDKMTGEILAILDEINAVPRQSHHLEKIHPWLINWGKQHGLDVKTDDTLNIVFKVPATKGYENAPTIVLQGHMDMVCEKHPQVKHDFQNDPIISWQDRDWLRAKGTTLGADNGIALAMFFHLITDNEVEHPPLEILITSDEETGLVGAQNLKPDFLRGKILLNLDSEDEGVFTIGCAGGTDINLTLPIRREIVPKGYIVQKIQIGGLEGGHSGIEIAIGKANANILLLRVIRNIVDSIKEARYGEISGGMAHNAIPRDAQALVAVPQEYLAELKHSITELDKVLKLENAAIEKNLALTITDGEEPPNGLFNREEGLKLLDALRLIPHGVQYMSQEIENAVETSMNFAVLRTENSEVKALTNHRSALTSRGGDFSETIIGLARLYGGKASTGNYYPPWIPQDKSDILSRAKRVWKECFDTAPEVEVTHAGLECGAIGAAFPNMEMLSFGPTIMQPHSPDERMHIPSVGRVNHFLRELLKSYKNA